MGGAVIIDDGGSTRIKDLNGDLTDLIKIDHNTHDAHQKVQGPFSKIAITFVGTDATAASPFAAGVPIDMNAGDSFTIFSGPHQRVIGTLVGAAPDCELALKGINNVDPIVHGEYIDGHLACIIANADPIRSIKINAAGPAVDYPVPINTIYTVVRLS